MGASRNRIVKGAAEIEATSGTNPGITPSADGFVMFTNANPIAVDTQFVELDSLRESFTKTKGLVGRQLVTFSPTLYVQGSGAAGTPIRFNDLLRACALQEAVATGSVVYTPRTNGIETASIEVSLDGVMFELNGAVGTFTVSGSAGQGVELNFNFSGIYNAPVNEPSDFSLWDGGTNRATTLKSADFTIANGSVTWDDSTPVANPLVVKSFNFDRGITIGERTDANATDGLAGLNVEDSAPTLQVVVEAKNTVTGLPALWADLTAATTHAVTWQVGTAAGNTWLFSVPQAQLQNATPNDADGGTRAWTLDYRVQSTADNGEFTITTK